MPISARETALNILERCRRDGAFSDALLGSALNASGLSGRDAALTSRLVYGTLQNAALCDYYVRCYSDRNVKIEPKVGDILRLSVYQLLFMDKIPTRAAVSEGVELCRKCGYARASGFVNAVLRKLASNLDSLPELPHGTDEEYLSVKYSHPMPLTALLCSEFGADEAEKLMAANNAPAPLTIQTNTFKVQPDVLKASLEAEGVECTPHPWLPACFTVSGGIFGTKAYENGLFYVQDAAARLSVMAAEPVNGCSLLDLCAAPGGKSFAAGIMMGDAGSILSRDLHENKLKRLREGADRLGITIITTEAGDATAPPPALWGRFDVVLADVPCSGLGVIRKKPDVRYKDISSIGRLPEVQRSILEGAAECVRPGGVLLYSTCTVLSAENEAVISSFLSAHGEFSAESFTLPDPVGRAEGGMITLLPHIHGTDGFFICRLRKKP